MKTLVLNSGSSSIKYSVFDNHDGDVVMSGIIEKIGESNSRHRFQLSQNASSTSFDKDDSTTLSNHEQALESIFSRLTESGAINSTADLGCIGHRVVHGGEHFRQPVVVNDEVIAQIRKMIPLAPLHNPANLLGIELAMQQLPSVPQVAVFDTAFHQTLPEHAYLYPVPNEWYDQYHVRRYGFHGTSHHFVAKQAALFLGRELRDLNLITLHLGNGASVSAIEHGQSIDTSMGMTPLEGLMMGSRCGDIDPSLPFYLRRCTDLSFEEIESALNKHSGLKGICGENDMRSVHRLAEEGGESARQALAMYVYRIKKYLGAYMAVLGHINGIIFTGGIGENDAWLREQCCAGLNNFGIVIDAQKNQAVCGECCAIGSDRSVPIMVIKTHEEREIAFQAVECVKRIG